MAMTEEARHDLFQRLEEALGHDEAVTLMEHLPPVGWADVATRQNLDELRAATTRDLDNLAIQLRLEMVTLLGKQSTELRAEISKVGDAQQAAHRQMMFAILALYLATVGTVLGAYIGFG